MKPQPLPYTKKGLFGAQGIGARVGQSVGTFWSSLTSGVASSLLNRSLGITAEKQALPAQPTSEQVNRSIPSAGKGGPGDPVDTAPSRITEEIKRQIVKDTAKVDQTVQHPPTLVDQEMESLYSGFQKRRKSHQSDASRDSAEFPHWQDIEDRARRLKREEAKVRALNSNGRVDYSIQE